MITSLEAREATHIRKQELETEQWLNIEKAIKEAIERGNNYTWMDKVTNTNLERLKELGYIITFKSAVNTYEIKW